MASNTLTTTAACRGCTWTAPAGDWEAVDKAAEKHEKATGHAVVTSTRNEAAIIAVALATCRAEALAHAADPVIEAGPAGVLTCSMAAHHDGIVHYDPVDGVFWIPAQKGMTRDQAETVAARIREAMAA